MTFLTGFILGIVTGVLLLMAAIGWARHVADKSAGVLEGRDDE